MDQPQENVGLTPLGKLISVVLILALVGTGVYIVMKSRQQPPAPGPGPVAVPGPGGKTGEPEMPRIEAPDLTGITTVKEYKYVPSDRLPAVKGTSNYKWDENDKTLRFSFNVWAGWLPVIAANHGTKPSEESVFFKKHGFKVEMKLMDDPVLARDAYAAGDVHTLWGTVDMMVLFAPELVKDSRTAPRIVQQIDWSNGGDGIVVRKGIRNVADLKGKTIALALNSPSEYYVTSLLMSAGINPVKDVKKKYLATAFEAAAAFVSDPSVHACVSWAPDIYTISEKVPNTHILSSTADANKLIADVYAFRADFAKDHPEIVEGFVAGVFEGMDMVKKAPDQPCQWMADAFSMKFEEAKGMRNDAHATNFAENVQFFLNASNPTNFERTWKNASQVYRTLGMVPGTIQFDEVMDFRVIQTLQEKKTFAHQKDESIVAFTPATLHQANAEAPILTQTIRINFYPNSSNPYEPARDEFGNLVQGKLYDPNVDPTLEKVGRLAGQFATCVIRIDGHTDSSMKGKVPAQAVKDLSTARAEAIKRALLDKFKAFDPNKFVVNGAGWDKPFDANDAMNHALNRRVEISVLPPEQK